MTRTDPTTGLPYNLEDRTVTDDWVGTKLYTSWGYGQTQVNFAQIVDVSKTGKTVRARLVGKSVEARDRGSNSVAASDDVYGDDFRLDVRTSERGVTFRGSYPYIDGEKATGTRLDTFIAADDGTYHETPANQGR